MNREQLIRRAILIAMAQSNEGKTIIELQNFATGFCYELDRIVTFEEIEIELNSLQRKYVIDSKSVPLKDIRWFIK